MDNKEGACRLCAAYLQGCAGDVLIIGSVSGKTVPVVDMAIEAHKLGITIIAVTLGFLFLVRII